MEGRPVADAFIVAKAKVIGSEAIVISREKITPHAAKVANICEAVGVEYLDDTEFQKMLLS
jgi:hypothetical protein